MAHALARANFINSLDVGITKIFFRAESTLLKLMYSGGKTGDIFANL